MQASAPRCQVVARAVMAEEAEQQAQSTPSGTERPLSNQPSAQPECSESHSHDVLDIKFRLLQEIAGRHPLFCCCSTGVLSLSCPPPRSFRPASACTQTMRRPLGGRSTCNKSVSRAHARIPVESYSSSLPALVEYCRDEPLTDSALLSLALPI